jgi:hypothetical protein
MSSGLDEKQPVMLVISSNKIAAIEARLRVIMTFLSVCGVRFSASLPVITLQPIIGK